MTRIEKFLIALLLGEVAQVAFTIVDMATR